MPHDFKSQRGDIALYVAAMIVALLFILSAMFQLSLSAYSSSIAWDVRRQRDIEARAVASAAKEAILAVAETKPQIAASSLADELQSRVTAVTNGSATITLTSNASNAAVVLPANPNWPTGIPAAASSLDMNTVTGVGRSLQGLLSAGPVADLGTSTLLFTQSNSAIPTESPTYEVAARLFSVPVTNFTWIAYGRPTTPGGVVNSPPQAPSFSRGSGFTAPLAHAYSGETGTFPAMFGGIGDALPYYYRDLVSLTWNAFEFWTSLQYQNALLSAAAPVNVFDFTNPTNLPSGVTWDGTSATLDIGTTTASIIVVVDSLGGSVLRLNGAESGGSPVVVVVRNFSATATVVELASNNSRTILLYAPNSTLTPLAPGLSIRGGVLLFANSSVAGSMAVNGFVGYPQSFLEPPAITAYPDVQAQQDLQDRAPRALLVSTRGIVQ